MLDLDGRRGVSEDDLKLHQLIDEGKLNLLLFFYKLLILFHQFLYLLEIHHVLAGAVENDTLGGGNL